MKFSAGEGKSINFYSTKMVFKTILSEERNLYTTILMTHPPFVGPALHLHPNGPETFYIVEGEYTFTLDAETIEAVKGDFIEVPVNVPHKYKSGLHGGQMLVTSPPTVEKYFLYIAEELLKGEVSLEYEFKVAEQNGQIFLDRSDHWARKVP